MGDFWVPAVERTDALVTQLLSDSGAHPGDDSVFKFSLRFRDANGEVAASVGGRWHPRSHPSLAEERRMRRPWIVFAVIEASAEYVIWKLDIGTRHRPGDGWRIAARVPPSDVVEVREFPPLQGGRVEFLRPRRSDALNDL